MTCNLQTDNVLRWIAHTLDDSMVYITCIAILQIEDLMEKHDTLYIVMVVLYDKYYGFMLCTGET